jgi:2-amino-4-hydroxy-6-hydroxymethyldihydropteridine diphosphokinase
MVASGSEDTKVTEVIARDAFRLQARATCAAAERRRYRVAHFFAGGGNWKLTDVDKLVYLSLGSNLGDRAANLRDAISRLAGLGEVMAVSSFYETEPVELAAQPWFLNCAVTLKTRKMPRQLIGGILALEQEMGRRRLQKKGPRNIDIDILLFGSSIVETKGLTIPHPSLHERRFVLEPLAEIAPEVRHPVFKRTMRDLRDHLPPGQAVRKVSSQ